MVDHHIPTAFADGEHQVLQPYQPMSSGTNNEQAPSCPRCASTNTKFCYYNNYSLTQPRYFCKGCRRYWTKGGSLRSVPVGGGCRRRRRSKPLKGQSCIRSSDEDQGSPYSNSSSDSCSSNVEIDLATVFANYLNPNPGPAGVNKQPELEAGQGSESLLELEGLDLIDLPQLDLSFAGLDCVESFGHGMLQDDSCMSTDFIAWEAMVDLKELDSPPLESKSGAMWDQFSSTNMNQVMSDINWSSFDMEGYVSSFGA